MAATFPVLDRHAAAQDIFAAFAQSGAVVIENLFTADECEALRQRAQALVDSYEPGGRFTAFSSRTDSQSRSDYFIESADDIRFFFEEEAFDREGRLSLDKGRAINKIGHALHDKDSVFSRFCHDRRLRDVASTLNIKRPLIVQSMYIFKQPGIGGEVLPHQDSTYLLTEPESTVAFWIALEDATRVNGCLWGLPGGHEGPLRARHRRSDRGLITETLVNEDFALKEFVALEVPAGALIAIHGRLPHYSSANRSGNSRQAFVVHLVDETAHYLPDNWLQLRANKRFPAL